MFLSLPIVYEITSRQGILACRKRIPELSENKVTSIIKLNRHVICFQKDTFMEYSTAKGGQIILIDQENGQFYDHIAFNINDRNRLIAYNDKVIVRMPGKQYIIYAEDKKLKQKPCETIEYDGLSSFRKIYPIIPKNEHEWGQMLLGDKILNLKSSFVLSPESDDMSYYVENNLIYRITYSRDRGKLKLEYSVIIDNNIIGEIPLLIPCDGDGLSYYDLRHGIDDNFVWTLILSYKSTFDSDIYIGSHTHLAHQKIKKIIHDSSARTIKRIANFNCHYFILNSYSDNSYTIIDDSSGLSFCCNIDGYLPDLMDIYLQPYIDSKLVEYLHQNMDCVLNQSICRVIVEYCSF